MQMLQDDDAQEAIIRRFANRTKKKRNKTFARKKAARLLIPNARK